jgi:inosose dehydratase
MTGVRVGAGSDAWGIWHASHPAQIPWERYLDEVAEAGFRLVEPGLYGFCPSGPATMRRALADRGLAVPGGTFFADLLQMPDSALDHGFALTVDWLAAIGAGFVVLLDAFWRDPETGAARGPARLDAAAWDRMTGRLHRLGAAASEAGLRLVFHPHCDATIETEADIETLLARTDPGLVGLCLDTGHHLYSGGDPVTFYRRHAARIPYLHLKSMNAGMLATVRREGLPWARAVARGVTDELMRGAVDIRAFAAEMQAADYAGVAIFEQDMFPCDPAVPLPLARRTRAWLESLGFRS